jgi:hypothetical protein
VNRETSDKSFLGSPQFVTEKRVRDKELCIVAKNAEVGKRYRLSLFLKSRNLLGILFVILAVFLLYFLLPQKGNFYQ